MSQYKRNTIMSNNIFFATFKYIFVEILWDVVYFPIWWYSKGLVRVVKFCLNSAAFHLKRRVALRIWLKNMFKPMYGDYSKDGRIISFFFRIFILIWKLFSAVVWLLILFILFVVWIVLPLLVGYYLVYQTADIPFFSLSL